MSDSTRRKFIAGIYISLIFMGVIYYFLIEYTPLEVPCRHYLLTGKPCGGCGTTRMMLSIMKFDIQKAFGYNPVAFLNLCAWNITGICAFIGKPRFFCKWWFILPMTAVTILSLIFYTVIRSIC